MPTVLKCIYGILHSAKSINIVSDWMTRIINFKGENALHNYNWAVCHKSKKERKKKKESDQIKSFKKTNKETHQLLLYQIPVSRTANCIKFDHPGEKTGKPEL